MPDLDESRPRPIARPPARGAVTGRTDARATKPLDRSPRLVHGHSERTLHLLHLGGIVPI